MKPNLKFKKGEFITQNSCPNSFAIFGGDVYDPMEEGAGVDYSLICYYNPSYYEKDEHDNWVCNNVFEYDFYEGHEVCEYTINSEEMDYWRTCTQDEIDDALKFLAKKQLAWVAETNSFRKLGANEKLMFDDRNTHRTSPMYGNGSNSSSSTKKLITRVVKEDWEQKEPISSMDEERRIFVNEQCDKLKYAFNTYSSVILYPNNETDIPRRRQYYGYDACGYGMCSYNALFNSDGWGCYD